MSISFKEYCENRDLQEGFVGGTVGALLGSVGLSGLAGAVASMFGLDPTIGYTAAALPSVYTGYHGATVGRDVGDSLWGSVKKGWDLLRGKRKPPEEDDSHGGQIKQIDEPVDRITRSASIENKKEVTDDTKKEIQVIGIIKYLEKLLPLYGYPVTQIKQFISRTDKEDSLVELWRKNYLSDLHRILFVDKNANKLKTFHDNAIRQLQQLRILPPPETVDLRRKSEDDPTTNFIPDNEVDEEKVERAREMWEEGTPNNQIASYLGMDIKQFRYWLKTMRDKGFAAKNIDDYKKNRAIELYKSGFTQEQVASYLDMTISQFKYWLDKNGISKSKK